MITLLQISDIHFHAYPGEDEDEFAGMREKLYEDLDYVREHLSSVDTLLICGDIAFSGKKEEYNIAQEFIKSALTRLTKDGKEPSVFMVPGNHDKDRARNEETRYLLNRVLLDRSQQASNKFFNNIRDTETDTMKILYSPFEEYNNLASKYTSVDEIASSIIDGESLSGKKVYCKRLLGSLGDYTVKLIGINSALCCDKYDFSEKEPEKSHSLFLPKVACNQVSSKYEILVSIMHHPIEGFMLHADNLKSKFDHRFKIQLFGHIHKQSIFVDNTIKIYSGAFQPEEQNETEYFPVYNIITLNVQGSNLEVCVKSRKWNGATFENYEEGSVSYTISLEPVNTWTDADKEKAVVVKQEAVDMDKKYKVQKIFMDCPERKRFCIMHEYNYKSDDNKSGLANSVLFLKWIDRENKWDDLEHKLS